MTSISHYTSPIGDITMAGEDDCLTGLWFDGQKYDRVTVKDREYQEAELPVFTEAKAWLDLYFAGKDPGFLPQMKIEGSEFKKLISRILQEIPRGKVMTYKQIAEIAAERMGRSSMSAQAVGGAVGHNAISILIPCHRVVGAGGSLTGYAGGLERKKYLLENEGINLEDIEKYRYNENCGC